MVSKFIGKYDMKKTKNPMTRTWDNLLRWIYINLPKYAKSGKIDVEKAKEDCVAYFRKSEDPYKIPFSRGKAPDYMIRYRDFMKYTEMYNNEKTYYIKHESFLYSASVEYFSIIWENIQKLNMNTFDKKNLWRNTVLVNSPNRSDIVHAMSIIRIDKQRAIEV